MARNDQLADFVQAALSRGLGTDDVQRALAEAGWSRREIDTALGAWLPGDGSILPIPRPRPYVSAGEAVVYGLLFLMLGLICWHVASLGFDIIDSLLPEPGDLYSPPRSSLRWSIAWLLPTVPLFVWLNARVARATRGDPGQRRSLVRRWFAAVTLLLAALALLSDGVAVIYAMLNGDLTARFAAKAGLVALIGLLALAYYRDELDAG